MARVYSMFKQTWNPQYLIYKPPRLRYKDCIVSKNEQAKIDNDASFHSPDGLSSSLVSLSIMAKA